ncbi:LptF/LptG family permease [Sulfurimonas sp. HSL1-6]|uniref:LptF/LptG family permease n=1 Tax=Thiomicrolovo immobilis TaxID=3131935 RepID=UPI0031F92ACB
MLMFRYIAYHYLKYIAVILFALVFFMVGFDYMESADKLQSANLIVIYLTYKTFFAVDMLLPLSLVFAMIATKIFLIRSNALVAIYALGYNKTDVIKPFVGVAVAIMTLYIALHATSFARADEYANNIRRSAQYLQPTSNLFFTFKDRYVYFGKLYPLQERAEDIRIFTHENGALQQVLSAEGAYYADEHWHLNHAVSLQKPKTLSLEGDGITVTQLQDLTLLEGFRPKILDQVYEGKVNYTILDAIDALMLLGSENLNVDKIKSALYRIFITPLFVPSLIILIFFFVPISPRFLNITLFSFVAILATMMTWSFLFMLTELSNNKTIPSEVGIVLPVLALFTAALILWYRNRGHGVDAHS